MLQYRASTLQAFATCCRTVQARCKLLQHAAVPCKARCNVCRCKSRTLGSTSTRRRSSMSTAQRYSHCTRRCHNLHRDWAHPCHICTGTGLTPSSMSTAQRYRQFTCSHAPTQAALSLTKIKAQTRTDACTSCSACVRPAPCMRRARRPSCLSARSCNSRLRPRSSRCSKENLLYRSRLRCRSTSPRTKQRSFYFQKTKSS